MINRPFSISFEQGEKYPGRDPIAYAESYGWEFVGMDTDKNGLPTRYNFVWPSSGLPDYRAFPTWD